MMVQKWRISSNSQQSYREGAHKDCCLWWFKNEEFQAIHNKSRNASGAVPVVYDGSKMKNFKQFTTSILIILIPEKLSMMVQRWRISCNSQQLNLVGCFVPGCLWWFKDEEFQAIHNTMFGLTHTNTVVYDGSKMKNFKQFTTVMAGDMKVYLLSMMVQRWRISSNSQRADPP